MAFERKNAWNNGGTFDNPDLLWYARAVGVMKSKPISDPTSWWFYAAIHGQYLIYDRSSGNAPKEYPNWKSIKSIPESANLDALPPETQTDLFWSQCQHQTWFFPPWHRGYLAAFENIVRDIIVNELNGPADWALPYWNYLNISDKEQESYHSPIMPAFTELTLPDGTPNPLHVEERYGPTGNKDIYIPVGMETNDAGKFIFANDLGQFSKNYTYAANINAILNGYGGKKTQFNHYGGGGTGLLESNPHNKVHNFIGSSYPDEETTLIISAEKAWQSTGVTIQSGDNLYIEETRDSKGWTADPNDKVEGKKSYLYGIEGSSNITVSSDQPLYPVVDVPMGALVGRIGPDGIPFLIVEGTLIKIQEEGVNGLLELCINDDLTGAYGAGLTDNEGSVEIIIHKLPTDEFEGLMADPGIAALDPIFYIHHSNIDRLWAAWVETGNNENSNDPDWLKGPTAQGHSQFAMPMDKDGTPWFFTPEDVNSTTIKYYGNTIYQYSYDNLSLTTYCTTEAPKSADFLREKMFKLGAGEKINLRSVQNSAELVGMGSAINLKHGKTDTFAQLDNTSWKSVTDKLLIATPDDLPYEVFLVLEGVKGTNNSNFLSVFVNGVFVDSVSLFGIRLASMSEHGGAGLTFRFDISTIVYEMHLANEIDVTKLDVQIKTAKSIFGKISIDRISIYRV